MNRAWSLTNLERDDEAIEDCRRALDLDVNPARPLMYWGRNLSLQGKDEDAIDKFKEALDADPGNSEILVRWARSLWNLERYDEAMDKARRAIEIHPSNAEAHLQLALSLWMSDLRTEADDRFGTASKFAPERADILRPWGELLSTMGRHHDAIDKLRRANQHDPRDARTLMIWGKCLSDLGRYAESVKMCQQSLDIDSSSPEAHAYLAQSLAEIHKTEEAMRHFSEASSLAPGEAWIYELWAEALVHQKNYAEAEDKFRRAAECTTDPKTIASTYAGWGGNLSRLGRNKEAEEKYREALKIEPKNIEWLINLAHEIAYQGRLDEARDLLLKAEGLGPATQLALGNLGWGFYQIGEYEKSLSYSRRALTIEPDALYSLCNAGLALLHLNRPDEAGKEYEHAVRVAERTAAAEDFAYHATGDIEDALKKRPDLPGGRAVLDSLREHVVRLGELRKRSL